MSFSFAQKLIGKSGRWAIMAREDIASPWVQVESVLGVEEANKLVEQLEYDDEERHGYIYSNGDSEGWGEDDPVEMPK